MRVLITGATGQLGTDLVQVCQSQELIPLSHADLDITDYEAVKRTLSKLRPEVVINSSAYVSVDEAEMEAEKAFLVNAVGALNLARVCRDLDMVNVYISTDYVFDGEKGSPYKEDDKPNPINVYGLSKYAGEIFTQNYSPKHYIIRVASLYGKAGARGKKTNFVNRVIQKGLNREELKVVEDIFMSPTYTQDASQMIYRILENRLDYGIYHLVNDGYCSWFEFAKQILIFINCECNIVPINSSESGRLAKRPKFSALVNRKLMMFGLKMRSWKEALRDYLSEEGLLIEQFNLEHR